MQKIVIIDYGMGNISSIKNMLRYIGCDGKLSNNANEILAADKLILPGVGNFGHAMQNISELNLKPILDKAVLEGKKPILGICLGMQLLLSYSEEGNCEGLNWIDGKVKKFDFDDKEYKVPHMGWDYVKINNPNSLVYGVGTTDRYYFVHSYYASCDNREDCIASTDYGIEFDSIIGKNNIWGTQFHPEKSHKFGMKILNNFLEV